MSNYIKSLDVRFYYTFLHIQGWDEAEAESLSGPVVLMLEASHHSLPNVLKSQKFTKKSRYYMCIISVCVCVFVVYKCVCCCVPVGLQPGPWSSVEVLGPGLELGPWRLQVDRLNSAELSRNRKQKKDGLQTNWRVSCLQQQ